MSAPAPPPARNDWAYFLDFDGTLLDLAATPDAIRVDAALPILLDALLRACSGAVALISGRSLADLDRHLVLPALPKTGQHGLERRDAAGRLWLHAAAPQAKQAIRAALARELAGELTDKRRLLIEDKGLTLALHYRQAPELASHALALMHRLVAETGGDLVVQEGKCVVEVKPAGVDKGTAVAEYLAEPPFLGRRPVFIGDDRNDEHGFDAVNARDGLSIGVGHDAATALAARYRLADAAAVRAWLSGALGGPP